MTHSARALMAAAVAAFALTTTGRALPVAQAARGAPRADTNQWTIDSGHSSANFSVRHLVVSTVRGRLGPISGTVWYDGTNISSLRVEATIDATKLSTNNDARDRDLRSPEFFDTEKHPNLTFKSKRAEAGADGHFTLIGDLTIRETTKEVSLDVEGPLVGPATAREQRLAATATTTINRFDYGLKYNQLVESGGAVVSNEVKITIDLEVTRPPRVQ